MKMRYFYVKSKSNSCSKDMNINKSNFFDFLGSQVALISLDSQVIIIVYIIFYLLSLQDVANIIRNY